MIARIYTLGYETDTPWSYRADPGIVEGPWAETVPETVAAYQAMTGLQVRHWWDRGEELWLYANEKASDR